MTSRWRFSALALCVCAMVTVAHAQQTQAANPRIDFGDSSVIARDVTPGASVVFFGISFHGAEGASQLIRWRRVLADDDHDGKVTLEMGAYALNGSLWCVVDLTNAHYAIRPYIDASYNDARNPQQPFSHSGSGAADLFAFHRPLVYALYVHPGIGGWTWFQYDGSPSDKDGRANGITTIDLAAGNPLKGTSTPPKGFVAGGVLIAIDWWHMDVLALRLTESLLGGAQ